MKLSILTATYNRAKYLPKLYESIKQNLKCELNSEWIIVDDGSEDDTKNQVQKFIDENSDIKSSCHESTLFLLPRNPNYIAVTARSTNNLYEKYFHSFIIDGEYVIDLTSNLYMKKEEYYELYKVEELNVVKGNDVIKESEESKPFDSSNTLFPLLRNAIYKCEMKKNRKLS